MMVLDVLPRGIDVGVVEAGCKGMSGRYIARWQPVGGGALSLFHKALACLWQGCIACCKIAAG